MIKPRIKCFGENGTNAKVSGEGQVRLLGPFHPGSKPGDGSYQAFLANETRCGNLARKALIPCHRHFRESGWSSVARRNAKAGQTCERRDWLG